MAGVVLRYSIHDAPSKEFLERLSRINTRPLMDEIGAYVVSVTNERFEQGITPTGESWKPSQRALREGGKTLIDHGHLRDSYTHIVLSDHAVDIGSDLPYAHIHHKGGKAGRNHSVTIDPRPALGINDADRHEIQLITHDFLRDASDGALQ